MYFNDLIIRSTGTSYYSLTPCITPISKSKRITSPDDLVRQELVPVTSTARRVLRE